MNHETRERHEKINRTLIGLIMLNTPDKKSVSISPIRSSAFYFFRVFRVFRGDNTRHESQRAV